MKTTTAFPEPNYTQTPNNFFEMLPEMSDAEIRVSLVMIRQTFGFHREEFKMGIHKLALASGLSDNGAKAGAEAAQGRGTFRRANPDSQTEAEWELVVEHSLTPSTSDPLVDQPVTHPGSTSDPHSADQRKEKKEKKGDWLDGMLELSEMPGAKKSTIKQVYFELLRKKLVINPSGKRWEDFINYAADRQMKDQQPLEKFLSWALVNGYDPRYWTPDKMQQLWPQAFSNSTPGKPPQRLPSGL